MHTFCSTFADPITLSVDEEEEVSIKDVAMAVVSIEND
jgi:hypothetical protein